MGDIGAEVERLRAGDACSRPESEVAWARLRPRARAHGPGDRTAWRRASARSEAGRRSRGARPARPGRAARAARAAGRLVLAGGPELVLRQQERRARRSAPRAGRSPRRRRASRWSSPPGDPARSGSAPRPATARLPPIERKNWIAAVATPISAICTRFWVAITNVWNIVPMPSPTTVRSSVTAILELWVQQRQQDAAAEHEDAPETGTPCSGRCGRSSARTSCWPAPSRTRAGSARRRAGRGRPEHALDVDRT